MGHQGNSSEELAIGIDFGSSHFTAGVYVNGQVEIIPLPKKNEQIYQNLVTNFPNIKNLDYGSNLKKLTRTCRLASFVNLKQIIGPSWEKIVQEISKSLEVDAQDEHQERLLSFPQETAAKLLSEVCQISEDHLKLATGSLKKIVLTVPAFFTDSQRRAILEAAEISGLQVLSLLNEHSAAALAYTFAHRPTEQRTVFLYDFGSSSFQTAVIKITEGYIKTLGVDRDAQISGQNIDLQILEYCTQEFQKIHKTAILTSRPSLSHQLLEACQAAKEELSSSESTVISVPSFHGDMDLKVMVTRATFEEIMQPISNKTLEIVNRVIKNVKELKSKEDIDEIILVGGSTKIPMVHDVLKKYFLGKLVSYAAFNPQEIIAYGAAVHAGILTGTLDLEIFGPIEIQDITTTSVGVETRGDRFSCIIPKNTGIPCEQKFFRTVFDREKKTSINVFQGEKGKASENEKVGEFLLEVPISSRLGGFQNVEVTMKIDMNGVLEVIACQQGTENVINVRKIRKSADLFILDR